MALSEDVEKTIWRRQLYSFHSERATDIVTGYRSSVLHVVGLLIFLLFPTFKCSQIRYAVVLPIISATMAVVLGYLKVNRIFEVRNDLFELIDTHRREQVQSSDFNLEDRAVHGEIKLVTRKMLFEIYFVLIFSVFFSISVALHILFSKCEE